MSISEANKWYLIGSSPDETISQTVKRLSCGKFIATEAYISIGNAADHGIPTTPTNEHSNELNSTSNPILTNPLDSRIIIESNNSNANSYGILPFAVDALNKSDNDKPFGTENWGQISPDEFVTPKESNNLSLPYNISIGVWAYTDNNPESQTWKLNNNFTLPQNSGGNDNLSQININQQPILNCHLIRIQLDLVKHIFRRMD